LSVFNGENASLRERNYQLEKRLKEAEVALEKMDFLVRAGAPVFDCEVAAVPWPLPAKRKRAGVRTLVFQDSYLGEAPADGGSARRSTARSRHRRMTSANGSDHDLRASGQAAKAKCSAASSSASLPEESSNHTRKRSRLGPARPGGAQLDDDCGVDNDSYSIAAGSRNHTGGGGGGGEFARGKAAATTTYREGDRVRARCMNGTRW
jgi:hypothetical protein